MAEAVIGAILLSALSAALLIRFSRMHIRYSADGVGGGPQKFHHFPTPRIGGVAIFAGLTLGLALLESFGYVEQNDSIFVVISALPVFLTGLTEDLTKQVSARARLTGSFAAAALAIWLLDAELRRFDIPLLDLVFQVTPVAMVISVFCIAGVAHALNIIDGYNGLAAGVGVIILSGLGLVGVQVHDAFIFSICAVAVGTLLGFLLLNYPRGSIFAGDSGAYLIGFLIALVSVLLVARNSAVSAWCPMLLTIYPVWETLFSIYRKKYLRGGSPQAPDGLHLHMLIYKRLVRIDNNDALPSNKVRRNARTSPYLWLLTAISVVPAALFWNNTPILMGLCFGFVLLYCSVYWSIVKFKSPKWLHGRIRTSGLAASEAKA